MTLGAAVAVLLTGCGSEDPKAAVDGGKPSAAPSPSATPPAGSSSSAPAKSGGATHQVTLEVGGTGKTAIMFSGIGSGFEQQTLPWSKSGTAELTAAEQKVGYLVNVVPGTITGAGGKLQQAPCKITVDGRTVAESDGVTTTRGCSYTIKQ
ncbi:hypothetical protein ACFWUZ_07515 [Streptomyces sp. NPDC058646]|uniref:hypothetical protein n=1 Tax=Streptomyces sp. NPDC058646 TaxID=3346574 RepID=UPI003658AB1B